MLKSYQYLFSSILLLILPLFAFSQDKKVITFKDLGFEFSIPLDWEGKETEAAYLLTSPNDQGFVMISTMPYTDIIELKGQLNGGIKKENGFFLAPTDQIETINENQLQGKFSGLNNFSPIIAYLVVLRGDQQQMVMVMSANSKENYTHKNELLAVEIASDFKFFKPQMPSLVDEYKALVNDAKLTFIESDGLSNPDDGIGYQTKITLDLCSQGFFNFYNFRSEGMASAFSADNNKGEWDIIKNDDGKIVLQLRFYNGELYNYEIEYLEGKIYLDGDHYLRTTDGDIKYKPDCN